MIGKNDPTTFLPLKSNIDVPVQYVKDKENTCLITDQAKVYL